MKKVRLWQLAVNQEESIAARKNRILAGLPAVMESADLVMLPELWLSGAFNLDAIAQSATEVTDDFISELQALSDATKCALLAGTFPAASTAGRFFNTAFFFQPNKSLTTYRKQHLFGFADGERTIMDDSSDLTVVKTDLGQLGLSICYDLRFPELYRDLISQGAEVFLIPAGWPAARINHWEVLVKARAIENQAFVFAVNAVGEHAGVLMGGRSVVVDPTGVTAVASESAEEVLEVLINPTQTSQVRADFPVLQDRKIK